MDPDMLPDLERFLRGRLGAMLKGKWTIERLLGSGGMAAVYAARHRNGSRVAVKMLHPILTLNAEARARFLKEGYAANAVEHPGVVRVQDDDIADDGSIFLIMELLEGETLEARCRRSGGRLSASEVLTLADQLLDVLAAAHDRRIIHRDIKPSNLFLNIAGELKILDFGIAHLHQAESAQTFATKTGLTMGTPAFMPPEQARGRWQEVDGQSDLWAAGATMFWLLTGEMVHCGSTPNEVLLSAMTQPAPALSLIAPHVPAAVARVVDRALAFEKVDRWRHARDMQTAIRAAREPRVGAATALLIPAASHPASAPEVDPTTQHYGGSLSGKTTPLPDTPRLPATVPTTEAGGTPPAAAGGSTNVSWGRAEGAHSFSGRRGRTAVWITGSSSVRFGGCRLDGSMGGAARIIWLACANTHQWQHGDEFLRYNLWPAGATSVHDSRPDSVERASRYERSAWIARHPLSSEVPTGTSPSISSSPPAKVQSPKTTPATDSTPGNTASGSGAVPTTPAFPSGGSSTSAAASGTPPAIKKPRRPY